MEKYIQTDIIIIGGGIAGLYSANKIKKLSPNKKIILLEKENVLGGRASNEMFHGTSVVTGAGIGRKRKDKLLLKLMRELEIPIYEFETGHHFATTFDNTCDVKKVFLKLKKEFHNNIENRNKTFKEYATSIIGCDLYNTFIKCAGYTDYENEDAYETLYNYGFDDNYEQWTGFSVPWKKLMEILSLNIGIENIHLNNIVTKINPKSNTEIFIHSKSGNKNDIYLCEKVIMATTIESVLKLIPNASSKNSIYNQIHGQPFIRLYGKFSKSSIPIMKKYVPNLTVVPGPLQKIIPMNPDEGIYMIAYNDNKASLYMKKFLQNNHENRSMLCTILELSLGIKPDSLKLTSMKDYYWDIGTHYFEPLREPFKNRMEFLQKAQNPYENMIVVGELLSTNQGWVEGSLESVENVLNKKWIL